MKQVISNLWQENETLSMINQMQIMMYKTKLFIIQNFENLIFSDYNNACILIRGNTTIIGHHQVTQVSFKNCVTFTKCITKVYGTVIVHAEDLDLVMSMYNLIENSSKYSETTGRLWFYSKDETTNFMLILVILIILNLWNLRLIY